MKEIVVLMTALVLFSCGSNAPNSIEEKPNNKSKIEQSPIFNLAELIDINKMTPSQVENYLLEKGYEQNNSKVDGDSIKIKYRYTKKNNPDGNFNYIDYTFPKKGKLGSITTTWTFFNPNAEILLDSIYLKLKKETENSGFKYFTTNSVNNYLTNFCYAKGEVFVEFFSGKPMGFKIFSVSIHEIVNKNEQFPISSR